MKRILTIAIFTGIFALVITGCKPEKEPVAAPEGAPAVPAETPAEAPAAPEKPLDHPAH